MTNNLPLISIGIPAYNHENFIEETINSAIAQTYENLELIIIDDGSKDATWQKICDMKDVCNKRFKNVTFITQKNQGTCVTINKIISLMQGEYFVNCASDDVFTPTLVEKLYNVAKDANDVVLVGADMQAIDDNSNPIPWTGIHKNAKGYKSFYDFFIHNAKNANFDDKFGDYELLLRGNFIPNLVLVKTSSFRATGGFTKEAPLEDWYMNLQLAKQGRFKFVNEILSLYRVHGTNTSANRPKMRAIARKTLLYEQSLVMNSDNEELKQKFLNATTDTKSIFKLGAFSFNTEKTVMKKRFFFSLCDKSLTILSLNRK